MWSGVERRGGGGHLQYRVSCERMRNHSKTLTSSFIQLLSHHTTWTLEVDEKSFARETANLKPPMGP